MTIFAASVTRTTGIINTINNGTEHMSRAEERKGTKREKKNA